MKKKGIIIVLLLVFLCSNIFAGSVDSEMNKVTHYAQEYETGNINYVQFMVYLSSVREGLNEILGATNKEYGGILKQEQVRSILGEAQEETKWVWVEGENHERKLDDYLPIWRKIIFDGKKIRITLGAYPSIFKKCAFEIENDFRDFKEEYYEETGKYFEDLSEEEKKSYKESFKEKYEDCEEHIIYRLNFEKEFKSPKENLDINSKIDKIQNLAEIFNSEPTRDNADELAKASVSAERIFESFFRQNQGSCEEIMNSIFGSENKRDDSKTHVQEINFFEGENFEAILRLEMCDECEWNWINLNMWFEGRGNFKYPDEIKFDEGLRERYKQLDSEEFKIMAIELIEKMALAFERGDYNSAMKDSMELQVLNDAWNEVSNDNWEEVDKIYQEREEAMSDGERNEMFQNYGWIKLEQEKREKQKELRLINYEERKNFYVSLFSGYEKREFYFEQEEYEKRLVEEFKTFGKEICDNNEDDNDDGAIDCSDSQCGGKVCGKTITSEIIDNETIKLTTELYCIKGTCQAKEFEEKISEKVCGNNICEEGENVCSSSSVVCSENDTECFATADCGEDYCPEDCVSCPEHGAIECDGKVIFSGKDESGCPLKPICLNETEFCEEDSDCADPLCGDAVCSEEKICVVEKLTECNESECVDGEEKIKKCEAGEEVISEICSEGIWKTTGAECEGEVSEDLKCTQCGDGCYPLEDVASMSCVEDVQNIKCVQEGKDCVSYEKEVFGEECSVKEDCGGVDDVCSNGKCVAIPHTVVVENEEEEEINIDEFIDEEKIKESLEVIEEELEKEEAEHEEENKKEFKEVHEEKDQEEKSGKEFKGAEKEEKEEEINEESSNDGTLTGSVIFNFFNNFLKLTGRTVEDDSSEDDSSEDSDNFESDSDNSDDEPNTDEGSNDGTEDNPNDNPNDNGGDEEGEGNSDCPDAGDPPEVNENCWYEKNYDENGCVSGYDVECGEKGEQEGNWEDNDEDWEEHKDEWHEDCDERCERECDDRLVKPCVDKCVHESGCLDDGNCDDELDECKSECEGGADMETCKDECKEKCKKGEDTWIEPEWEEPKQEQGVFSVGGGCRTSQGKTEGYMWFNGWGEPFEDIQELKNKYYQGGETDWCKMELENLIKQRREFEKGLNREFAKWFFEIYIANTAEDWEQHQSGIYELYWNVVDNSRQMAERMNCLRMNGIPFDYRLVNFSYETDYGRIEYFEEISEISSSRFFGDTVNDEKVEVITPYMKVWIFPPEEFIKNELKKAMVNEEFPGSPEEKMKRESEGGLKDEEKENIKQDEGFMKRIRKLSEKYYGEVNAVVRFVDYEEDSVVFNLYAVINEEDIIKFKPMLPENVPSEDVRIELDFKDLYEIIYTSEKEMQGENVEFPDWAQRKISPINKIKEIRKGIGMFFKIKGMVNDAEITPKEAEKDVDKLFNDFLWMMMKGGMNGEEDFAEGKDEHVEELEQEILKSKEKISGQMIG
ncbi:MAG: hypothetical protein PVJ67_05250 [Candidatus Pacearchaeota archaeon]|jgi:hypothetical protein